VKGKPYTANFIKNFSRTYIKKKKSFDDLFTKHAKMEEKRDKKILELVFCSVPEKMGCIICK